MSGTYNLGRIGLKVCGAYSATEEYNYLDIVRYNGASYIAKEAVSGVVPTDASCWELLAGSSIRVVYDSTRQSVSFVNSSEQTKLSYTLQEDGLYAVIANTQFPTGSGGTYRFSALKYTRNGGTNEIAAQTCPPQTGAGPRLSMIGLYEGQVGDAILLRANQNSGSSVSGAAHLIVVRLDAEVN